MFKTIPFIMNVPTTAPLVRPNRLLDLVDTVGKCINAALPAVETVANVCSQSHHRRTDEELSRSTDGLDKTAKEFQYRKHMPLSAAVNCAQNTPGVYVLYLNGMPMKCGRAAYSGGVAWRLRQYYNLNYDDRARAGDYWSVSPDNRDRIMVSWQCCPPGKCRELEYKLFQKYGKGMWAHRAPASCDTDDWDLLI